MYRLYSEDNAIRTFFDSLPTVTQQQCNDFAASLAGNPTIPVPIQGAFSYTVQAGAEQAYIVQFRTQNSALDLKTLARAREIHGQIVAAFTYHGNVGPLSVYKFEKLPGITYIQARYTADRFNTVEDFARFFAASWKHSQTMTAHDAEAIHHEYKQKLDLLSRALPPRFTENVKKVLEELPLLFTSTYPLVLSHGDLNEMNIIVDPDSGHITGVVDWAEARILPFGISLWGLENTLGYMDSKGWHYYNNHHELEKLFWKTFEETIGEVTETHKQAIGVARMAGFFFRYGFVWEDRVREIPAKEPDPTLRYLDAFCTTCDRTATWWGYSRGTVEVLFKD
ncbi:MAG: hypothetical protein M1840_008587 [Geoglossum simile]|nr:MAG: hypothetical protein M1840_008587 [Geoglossum simile]